MNGTMRRGRRTTGDIGVLVAATAMLAGAPGAAWAGDARVDGSRLVYNAQSGETNTVTIAETAVDATTKNYLISDIAGVTVGEGCIDRGNQAECNVAFASEIRVTLGDQSDDLNVSTGAPPTVQINANGGSGIDFMTGGTASDHLEGDQGNDILRGGAGRDELFGNTDDDVLFGDAGRDTLDGGTSDDRVNGGVDGDVLMGSTGDDDLRGNDGADTLQGGADNDRLFGDDSSNDGDDDAADTFVAGTGDDRVFADDGIAERIDCGGIPILAPGRDEATIDTRDRELDRQSNTIVGCETVFVFARI